MKMFDSLIENTLEGLYPLYGLLNTLDKLESNDGKLILVGGNKQTVRVESPVFKTAEVCAPNRKKTFESDGTCYSEQEVIDMAKSLNIPVDGRTKHELYELIKEKMNKDCDTEWCWAKKLGKNKNKNRMRISVNTTHSDNEEMFSGAFKPLIPKGKYDWLTTDDIEMVIKQFITVTPTSAFLGAVPIDFATYSGTKNNFSNATIQKLIDSGVNKFAIVLNTDPSTKSGQHWIGLFIRLNSTTSGEAYFYDSFGTKQINHVPKQIRTWVEKFPAKLTLQFNKQQHQRKNTECGVYSIHFIVSMLQGENFDDIKNYNDEQMNKYRDVIYRKYI